MKEQIVNPGGLQALSEQIGTLYDVDNSPLSNMNETKASVCGNIKVLFFGSTAQTVTQNVSFNCGTLPTKYRPNNNMIVPISGNERDYKVIIDTNGVVTLTPLSASATGIAPYIGNALTYI